MNVLTSGEGLQDQQALDFYRDALQTLAGAACTRFSNDGARKYPTGARIPTDSAAAVMNAW